MKYVRGYSSKISFSLIPLAKNSRIRETQKRDPDRLHTMAAAYAEAGRFGDAIDVARRSISLARADGDSERAARFEGRLRILEQGKPLRATGPKPARE